jgi:hypothetical protein
MSSNVSEYIINARRFRPKDSHLSSVTQVVNQLAQSIALGNNKKRKSHLKHLILDLYARFKESIDGWIYYSRDPDSYNISERYNRLGIAYRPLIGVIDRLLMYGMLEQKKGFYDEETGRLFQTRIRPTQDLIAYFENIPTSEIKETYLNDAAIRLRTKLIKDIKGKKVTINRLIPYSDNPYTDSINLQVKFYNNAIKDCKINLHIPTNIDFDRNEIEPTEIRINLNQKSIHRVFNDSFDRGGRFYGGWWQNVPKKLRDYILINDEPTIELDFKGFHIALLYALEGIDYYADDPDKDPYKVEGFDRDTVKLLLQTILNSKNKNLAKKGFRQSRYESYLPQIPNEELNILIDSFETMHAPIADYFYKEQGLYLQNLDARIAEHVIHDCMESGVIDLSEENMTERSKFVVLPIHDSFRVQVKYVDLLKRIMIDSLELAGRELNYFQNKSFYNYQPQFSYSNVIDLGDSLTLYTSHDEEIADVLPELKLLYKYDKNQEKAYFKMIN